jgi:hypothetical protein
MPCVIPAKDRHRDGSKSFSPKKSPGILLSSQMGPRKHTKDRKKIALPAKICSYMPFCVIPAKDRNLDG